MIFICILIFGVFFLFLSIRQIAPGNKGSIIAGIIVLLLPVCFFFREQLWANLGQAFLSVWLCEALLVYLAWLCVRLVMRLVRRKPLSEKVSVLVARVLLAFTFVCPTVICAVGHTIESNYKIRTLDVESAETPFSILFFTDLHLSPIFNRAKLMRMIADADSIKPDFILFGGDFADIHNSQLVQDGYDSLLRQLALKANVGAYAVTGNHEGYMERNGSDPIGFLRSAGWIFLDDSTACTPLACITGRTDFQVAGTRGTERKALNLLEPRAADSVGTLLPWIVLDHQPKGIEKEHFGRLPDFALSGHTHNGQFFPGTVIIGRVWRLAYGYGMLDGVRWLVSSGVGSWGPTVRFGSETEMWVVRFVPGRKK